MNVFMVGWEFPPFISGGLGTACYGLTKALDRLGIQVTFVLPKANTDQYTGHVRVVSAQDCGRGGEFCNVKFHTVASTLQPYASSTTKQQTCCKPQQDKLGHLEYSNCPEHAQNYGGDMYTEVYRYAGKVAQIAAAEEFDIIHTHDWMTYPAGIAAARLSGKPLLVQVHSTEFDRSGEHVNQMIYDIERQGMHTADKIVAVSNFTKNIIIRHYGVAPEKVEVVYNGAECSNNISSQAVPDKTDRVVLFLGRITMQKGPEYFIAAAKKVLEIIDNVKFVMAGDGDMMHQTIELAAELGIGNKVLFTHFLRGDDVDRIYQMAELYVMPSVSEPFGIAPLEALHHNVPVLISKQSGIAEVLAHALKVDFWDIDEMANKIVAVLKYPPLQKTLRDNGRFEAHKFRWDDAAAKLNKIYEQTLASA